MNEMERWDSGVATLRREYKGLSPLRRDRADKLAAAIKACKEKIHLITEKLGAADICACCGGECCKKGKNHFRSIDLIIYLYDGKKLFDPIFESEICPYMVDDRCLMGPEFRPYNCITFICEKIESLLGEKEKDRFYAMEKELRSLYREMEGIFDIDLRCSLLSVFERQRSY